MKKSTFLTALFLTASLLLSNCQQDPEYIYVNVPGETEIEYVDVPGETVYEPYPVPNVCDDAIECANTTNYTVESHRNNEMSNLCIEEGCSNEDGRMHDSAAMGEYRKAVLNSWIDRNGGLHEVAEGGATSTIGGYTESITNRNLFPCLDNADLQAGLEAAMNKLNEVHSGIDIE